MTALHRSILPVKRRVDLGEKRFTTPRWLSLSFYVCVWILLKYSWLILHNVQGLHPWEPPTPLLSLFSTSTHAFSATLALSFSLVFLPTSLNLSSFVSVFFCFPYPMCISCCFLLSLLLSYSYFFYLFEFFSPVLFSQWLSAVTDSKQTIDSWLVG